VQSFKEDFYVGAPSSFDHGFTPLHYYLHSYDILGAGMLWKPKEARILMNFIDQLVNIGKHSRTKNVLTRCFTKNFQEF
jgi:hypothetical protein